jgi:hypothetical protein
LAKKLKELLKKKGLAYEPQKKSEENVNPYNEDDAQYEIERCHIFAVTFSQIQDWAETLEDTIDDMFLWIVSKEEMIVSKEEIS